MFFHIKHYAFDPCLGKASELRELANVNGVYLPPSLLEHTRSGWLNGYSDLLYLLMFANPADVLDFPHFVSLGRLSVLSGLCILHPVLVLRVMSADLLIF